MNKRIFAFILLFCIVLNLASCKQFSKGFYYDNSSEITAIESGKGGNTASSEKNTGDNAEDFKSIFPSSPIGSDIQVDEAIIENEDIEEPYISEEIENFEIYNDHTVLLQSEYYQFSMLNEKEKKLYNAIRDTVLQSKSIVNLRGFTVSRDEVTAVFQKLLADYPQFFYIARNCILIYGVGGKNIRSVVLLYTDGNVTDSFNQNISLVESADREVINQKIESLQIAVQTIVQKIPSNLPDVLKEKLIHDYIVNTVDYDHSAAENVENFDTVIPHPFDVYGAAVKHSAVCEGYSKLFQYLCYNVGINCTQVIGTADGGGHMWNAVCIDNKWYQIDVTWDDSSNIRNYSYFNLTTEKISRNHLIDYSNISVPQCDSIDSAFYNVFAVKVTDIKSAPQNYQNAVLNAKALGEKELYVYIEEAEINNNGNINFMKYYSYIQRYLLSPSSEFYLYISSCGMSLSRSYDNNREYIVLKLNYQN